jgi:hypothetical protein
MQGEEERGPLLHTFIWILFFVVVLDDRLNVKYQCSHLPWLLG